jgi:Cd2+/Zn2+-exporting ATPase
MEQAHRLRVLALDKTGTLTLGKPVVTDVMVLQGSRDEAVELAVALSERSDHPISRAMAALRDDNMFSPEVSGFRLCKAWASKGTLLAPAIAWAIRSWLLSPKPCWVTMMQTVLALEREGKTVVLLLREQTVLCVFAVADQVRAQSASAVAELKRLGIRPVMLTGTTALQPRLSRVRSVLKTCAANYCLHKSYKPSNLWRQTVPWSAWSATA